MKSQLNLWQPFAALAYMLAPMDRRFSLFAVLGAATLAAGCTPVLGPPPPGRAPPPPPPSGSASFSAADFAWSKRPGPNAINGRLTYRQGAVRFTCAGFSVVLTPETAWSRRRMAALYGSTERAALPTDEVRGRTDTAPPGDAGPFVKRTVCDASDRFSFSGLPDGAWYAITIARPVGAGPDTPTTALMRRVVTRGGRPVALSL
jgi:hypothetical protein